MTIQTINNIKNITLINQFKEDILIEDFYVCDLLSWVVGHVKKDNTALITINSSYNIVAVATLLNISCIIFCDNVMPKIEVINKANEEGIVLFTYPDSSFSLLKEICKYEI